MYFSTAKKIYNNALTRCSVLFVLTLRKIPAISNELEFILNCISTY